MLVNLSISEFKAQKSVEAIQIVRNPNTKKLFASAGGANYRVQGTEAKRGELDTAKVVEFMYEDDESVENSGIDNGCFVNQSEDNLVASL